MLKSKIFFLGIMLIISIGYISASKISVNPSSIVQGGSTTITISGSNYYSYAYFYTQGSNSPVDYVYLGCESSCSGTESFNYNLPSSFSPGNYTVFIFSLDSSDYGWISSNFSVTSLITENSCIPECSSDQTCINEQCISQIVHQNIGENKKDLSLYSSKMIFLSSDSDWKKILPFISATTWTDSSGNINKYPFLIYHNESPSFDADSSIHFIQQYKPDKLILIGDTSPDLDNVLIASPDLGAGLSLSQISRIHPDDYLDYWNSFNKIVYVEDDYSLALLASTYASLINAPLIIQGTDQDSSDIFSGRNVICVGNVNPSGSSCSETYNLEQLQAKYAQETKTDGIIVVNPSDYDSYYLDGICPDKSPYCINQIYGKTSLIAPIIASSRHELIVSTDDTGDVNPKDSTYSDLGVSYVENLNYRYYSQSYQESYQNIGNFIHSKLSGMNYLTIMASPYAIPIFWPKQSILSSINSIFGAGSSLDPNYYADITGDGNPDVAVGRIAGLSVSDVSSYAARDLFIDSIQKTNNAKFFGSSFDGLLATMTKNIESYFQNSGYNAVAITSDEDDYNFNPDDWKNQDLIYYADHGGPTWAGINAKDIPNLDNSLIAIAACDTISSQDGSSFWVNAIRKGAVGFLGAVATTSLDTSAADFTSYVYYNNYKIGDAFKDSYSSSIFQSPITLIGDPVLNVHPSHLIKQKINLVLGSYAFACQQTGNFCGFGILFNCCGGNVCSWFTCQQCLSAGTPVNLLNSGQCCGGSTTWTTKQDPNFCCWANSWIDWGCWWNAANCGTHTTNDQQICT